MGLHTSYLGHIRIEPALSDSETQLLREFGRTRHWDHPDGAWRVATHPSDDERPSGDLARYNNAAEGVPGLWCPWTACERGHCLHWDGVEKPYQPEAWLRYLIDTFLRPGAAAAGTAFAHEHGLTCAHVLNGMLIGERRETVELFALEVVDNEVTRRTLLPGEPGVDEWGMRSPLAEEDDRWQQLQARRARFAKALAADRSVGA